MTVRHLLLRAYPRSWREEYGAEFADILTRRHLTTAAVVDVLASATRQRLHRDAPWRIGAVAMALWTCVLMLLHRLGVPEMYWWMLPTFAVPFAVGSTTMLRPREARPVRSRPSIFALGAVAAVLILVLRAAIGLNGNASWRDWCAVIIMLLCCAGAAEAILRRNETLKIAALAATALVAGILPEIVASCVVGPTVTHTSTGTWYTWGIYFGTSLPISRWEYVHRVLDASFLIGLFLGLLGTFAGRFVSGIREGMHAH